MVAVPTENARQSHPNLLDHGQAKAMTGEAPYAQGEPVYQSTDALYRPLPGVLCKLNIRWVKWAILSDRVRLVTPLPAFPLGCLAPMTSTLH